MTIRVLDFVDGIDTSTAPTEGTFVTISSSAEAISASGEVTLLTGFQQFIKVAGDGSSVSASLTPFGTTPPTSGTIITLIGTDATDTVTFSHNDAADGMILNGDATLGENDAITVIYESNLDRYVELNRNF